MSRLPTRRRGRWDSKPVCGEHRSREIQWRRPRRPRLVPPPSPRNQDLVHEASSDVADVHRLFGGPAPFGHTIVERLVVLDGPGSIGVHDDVELQVLSVEADLGGPYRLLDVEVPTSK